MTTLSVPILALHVIVAVLGVGSIAAIAVVAGAARMTGGESAAVSVGLRLLLRYTVLSFAIMFVTGLFLDFSSHGTFHTSGWFRGSIALLVVCGVLHAQARGAVRSMSMSSSELSRDMTLRRVQRLAYAMCALVAAITILMELKPF